MAVNLTGVQTGAGGLARWSAILLGASIPISIATDNILTALFLACWLVASSLRGRNANLRPNAAGWIALALVGFLAAGLLWGIRDPRDGLQFFGKYADLLLLPLIATTLIATTDRRLALRLFAAAMLLTLGLSFALAAGLVPPHVFKGYPPLPEIGYPVAYPVVFKLHLTQNVLMAFGVFVFVLFARDAIRPRTRYLWLAAAVLGAANIVLMVPGRTGILLLLLLALYAACAWYGWRGLLAAVVASAAAGAILLAAAPRVADRVLDVVEEMQQWRAGTQDDSSTGLRLQYLRTSTQLIAERPLTGWGTGSFPRAYREKVAGTPLEPSRNPHNEYLSLAVQLGLGGPLLLLALWVALWRSGRRLPPLERDLVRGLALCFAVGCLFNSLLLDHTEGLLFAWLAGLATSGLPSATPGAKA
jgi:O-antigen ligase